jgi:hypothetical protein
VATFGSLDLGMAGSVFTVRNPKRWQVNAYPGVNGRERLDMGTDGGTVVVDSLAYFDNAPDFNAFENTMYALVASGAVYDVVDNLGNTIPDCFLERYEPMGRVIKDGNLIARKYRAIFTFDF